MKRPPKLKIGDKFSKLTIVDLYIKDGHGNIRFICLCDCGNKKIVPQYKLKNGNVKSCGCIRSEAHIKHGMYFTREHNSWSSMLQRCNNSNSTSYKYYGAIGIQVCDRWLKFENFFEDMGERPEGMSLDRIDNNEDYCKENCRWATNKEQANNKRNNI